MKRHKTHVGLHKENQENKPYKRLSDYRENKLAFHPFFFLFRRAFPFSFLMFVLRKKIREKKNKTNFSPTKRLLLPLYAEPFSLPSPLNVQTAFSCSPHSFAPPFSCLFLALLLHIPKSQPSCHILGGFYRVNGVPHVTGSCWS